MRQIKFRAWHQEAEEYYDGVTSNMFHWIEDGQRILLEQFTGLKDANGVDIYEGDVVRDHVGVGVVEYSDKKAAFKVNYNDGFAKWFIDYTLSGERDSIVVIGDAHHEIDGVWLL